MRRLRSWGSEIDFLQRVLHKLQERQARLEESCTVRTCRPFDSGDGQFGYRTSRSSECRYRWRCSSTFRPLRRERWARESISAAPEPAVTTAMWESRLQEIAGADY